MNITPVRGNPPSLIVKEASSTTLTFGAFYGGDYKSRQGETGNFGELPRHIRENAKMSFGEAFKSYKILNVDSLPKKKIRGGGTIAFYNKLERSSLKPGDKVINKITYTEGIVLAGKDGGLKKPCSEDKIIVRCIIQKGKNKGKHRDSYWNIENVEVV